jgi:transglutaminase-like putative cysteine protease
MDLRLFLSPADYIDSDHHAVRARAQETVASTAGSPDPVEAARRLYLFVRDAIRYDPYVDYTDPETFRASSVLAAGRGYCVGKASLYAALSRAAGIPARLGLADVRNHLATPKLLEEVGTDIFAFHGYTELFLDGAWVKATPTFNDTLCRKLGVKPLDFDGRRDALLQAFDGGGRRFMTYEVEHGAFFDVPVKYVISEMKRLYPRMCRPGGLKGRDMEAEAQAGQAA